MTRGRADDAFKIRNNPRNCQISLWHSGASSKRSWFLITSTAAAASKENHFLVRLLPSVVSFVHGGKESRKRTTSKINANDKLRQVRGNGRHDDYENERATANRCVKMDPWKIWESKRVNSNGRYQNKRPDLDIRTSFRTKRGGRIEEQTGTLITEVYERPRGKSKLIC